MFQNLRQGNQVFALHKSQSELSVEEGIVETTNASLLGMYPLPNYPLDITIRFGSRVVPYKGIPSSNESADTKEQTTGEEIFIACSREVLNKEIDRLRQEAVNHLNLEDFYRKRIVSCDSIKMQINPDEAQKAQQQAEMASMRSQLDLMQKQLSEQSEINRKLLEKLEGKETSSSTRKKDL